MQTHKLSYQGGEVWLTASEAKVLALLVLRSPETVAYHDLMECLGVDLDGARKNTLETLISRLRNKLAVVDRSLLTIHNKRNLGYLLTGELLIVN